MFCAFQHGPTGGKIMNQEKKEKEKKRSCTANITGLEFGSCYTVTFANYKASISINGTVDWISFRLNLFYY